MKFTDLLHAREFLAVPREAQRILQFCLEQMDIRTAPDGAVRFVIEGDVALLDRLAVWGRQANEAAAFDGDVVTGLMRAGCYVSVQREAQEILTAMLARLDVRPMHDGAVIFTVAGDVDLQDRLAVWGCLIEDLEDGDLDDEEGPDAEHDDRRGRPVLMVLPILDLRADLVAAPHILCAA